MIPTYIGFDFHKANDFLKIRIKEMEKEKRVPEKKAPSLSKKGIPR
jgi:hypothetical protein